jgi:LAO/AO transport system kinase
MTRRLTVAEYQAGILAQNRFILSKAITLIESNLASDQALANALIDAILPHTGNSVRIGITGVPGVGKSTFIEAFGQFVVGLGKKVAVLAIDPSSQRTQGSIMGDKTRMEKLSTHPSAYIRPSPAGSSLGGVSRKTRETLLLCEAAGYDVILVETVGVGQSETAVANMTDFFLLLMLAGAGDELQGIKKGIMEMADLLAITKADEGNEQKAKLAQVQYQSALRLFAAHPAGWQPQVLTCSALQRRGLEAIWQKIMEYQTQLQGNGYWYEKRKMQQLHWLQDSIQQQLIDKFYQHEGIKKVFAQKARAVQDGTLHVSSAVQELWEIFMNH